VTVYTFEAIGAELDFPPLAACRALYAAGVRLEIESWRRLPITDRKRLARLGAADVIDIDKVRAVAWTVPYASEDAVAEPDPERVPATLSRALPKGQTIPDTTWRAMTPLARFALVSVASAAPSILDRALAEIIFAPDSRRTRITPTLPAVVAVTSTGRLSSHLTNAGEVHMVDVGAKGVTERTAVARARVHMAEATFRRLERGDTPKGEVLATARIAGIQAAKRTWELIPLCHPISLTRIEIMIALEDGGVTIAAECDASDRTGVEMEAMVAASTAALTIYDMLKGLDRSMRLEVQLMKKVGGKSGTWTR
jgi:cyclic pyranopterin phosphate synthase